jgi:hypothetical protein
MYTSGYETYTYSDPSMIASSATLGAMIGTYSVVLLAFYVLLVIAQWKIFTKAGEAGWKSLIPIYNLVIMYKIVGLSPWLLLIYLTAVIPVVGYIAILILSIVSMVKLGKAFGKGTGFIVGLIFLTPIFQMILGFGSSTYEGPDTTK